MMAMRRALTWALFLAGNLPRVALSAQNESSGRWGIFQSRHRRRRLADELISSGGTRSRPPLKLGLAELSTPRKILQDMTRIIDKGALRHEPLEPLQSPPQPCCFKLNYHPPQAFAEPLYSYYHFIVNFAAPVVTALSTEAPGKKVVILPDWYGDEKFRLTSRNDPARTMQAHFNFLFGPLQTDVSYWADQSSYAALPCKGVDLTANDPKRAISGWALRFFRAYALQLAGLRGPVEATKLILIRRGTQGQGTCTGSCLRHLDERFFTNASSVLAPRSFVVAELDNMALADQIRLFSSASGIVGLRGAGLTNLLFAPLGTAVTEVASVGAAPGSHAPRRENSRFSKYKDLEEIIGGGGAYGECTEQAFAGCVEARALQSIPRARALLWHDAEGKAAAALLTTLRSAPQGAEAVGEGAAMTCHAAVARALEPPQQQQPSPTCYRFTSPHAHTSWDGGLFEYYHFLIDFAAPILYMLKDEPPGRKTLVLPEWGHIQGEPNVGLMEERFKLTYSKDPQRTMQAHYDFFFNPLQVELAYEANRTYYFQMDCKELSWDAGGHYTEWSNFPSAVYQHFRAYAHRLALVGNAAQQQQQKQPGANSASSNVYDAVILRRGSQTDLPKQQGGTCTGACRRHLDADFFEHAEAFCAAKGLACRVVETDRMAIKDQVVIFARARLLVGLHGAGLSNMIFMHAGSSVVELGERKYPCFETLALFKLGLNYATCPPNDKSFGNCAEALIAEGSRSRQGGVAGGKHGHEQLSGRWRPFRWSQMGPRVVAGLQEP